MYFPRRTHTLSFSRSRLLSFSIFPLRKKIASQHYFLCSFLCLIVSFSVSLVCPTKIERLCVCVSVFFCYFFSRLVYFIYFLSCVFSSSCYSLSLRFHCVCCFCVWSCFRWILLWQLHTVCFIFSLQFIYLVCYTQLHKYAPTLRMCVQKKLSTCFTSLTLLLSFLYIWKSKHTQTHAHWNEQLSHFSRLNIYLSNWIGQWCHSHFVYILLYSQESTQTSHWQAWPFVYYSIVSTKAAGSFCRASHSTGARKGRPAVMIKHSYSISHCYSSLVVKAHTSSRSVCVLDTRVSVRILLSALLSVDKTERIGKRPMDVRSVLFSLHFFSDQLWM